MCSCCAARKWARGHPIAYALNKLRNNAKRRKISFSLTLEQFTYFCKAHPLFLEKRGRFANCLTIDRRRSSDGYTIENIRIVDLSTNVWLRDHEFMDAPGYDLKNGNPFGDY